MVAAPGGRDVVGSDVDMRAVEVEEPDLDGLWLGGILSGLWRVLEDRIARGEADLMYAMTWRLEQLDKTRPYRS